MKILYVVFFLLSLEIFAQKEQAFPVGFYPCPGMQNYLYGNQSNQLYINKPDVLLWSNEGLKRYNAVGNFNEVKDYKFFSFHGGYHTVTYMYASLFVTENDGITHGACQLLTDSNLHNSYLYINFPKGKNCIPVNTNKFIGFNCFNK